MLLTMVTGKEQQYAVTSAAGPQISDKNITIFLKPQYKVMLTYRHKILYFQTLL